MVTYHYMLSLNIQFCAVMFAKHFPNLMKVQPTHIGKGDEHFFSVVSVTFMILLRTGLYIILEDKYQILMALGQSS